MEKLKPCPFCGGKPKINARQSKFIGQNHFGNKKLVWTVYIKCNKCHSRGKPIKTEPIKMYDEAHGSLGIGNFYCTEFWLGQGRGLMTATLNFEPYVERAIEAWNRRTDDATTVDAVEVVRCRDCKHYEQIPNIGVPVCTEFLGLTIQDADDFCSYGERKDGDGNG